MSNEVKPPEPTEYKPPASAEEENERFTTFLGKFLEEDDEKGGKASNPPLPNVGGNGSSSGSPSGASQVDIAAQINAALDAREKSKATDSTLENLTKEVAALKAPKSKKWFQPWTLFEG